jgi:hypothetical protein
VLLSAWLIAGIANSDAIVPTMTAAAAMSLRGARLDGRRAA